MKSIIVQHGGKIDIASELGKGPCFALALPLVTATAEYRIQ
jgi:chemotaxis protein histidine kinase CheA